MPSHAACSGKAPSDLAVRRRPAHVESVQGLEVQGVDAEARWFQPPATRVPGASRIEGVVVMHDGDAVPGQHYVELQGIDAVCDGAFEGRHRVLRPQTPGAAMPVNFRRPRAR